MTNDVHVGVPNNACTYYSAESIETIQIEHLAQVNDILTGLVNSKAFSPRHQHYNHMTTCFTVSSKMQHIEQAGD